MNNYAERQAAMNHARTLMKRSSSQLSTWSTCMFIGFTSLISGAAVAWVIPFADTTDQEKQGWGLWIMAFAAVVLVIGFISYGRGKQSIDQAFGLGKRFGFDPSELER